MAPRNQFEEGFSSALERLQTFPGIDSKVIQVNFKSSYEWKPEEFYSFD